MLYYKNFFECLEKLYPEIKFDRFKFFHKGRGFWQDESNHKIALLYLGDKLGFKKKEDWYTLLHDDFENAGLISLIGASKKYEGSVAKAVCLNLPELKNALYVARKAIIVDLTKNMSIPPFVIRRCGFFKSE